MRGLCAVVILADPAGLRRRFVQLGQRVTRALLGRLRLARVVEREWRWQILLVGEVHVLLLDALLHPTIELVEDGNRDQPEGILRANQVGGQETATTPISTARPRQIGMLPMLSDR